MLNGYGGFSIIETPELSPMIAAWCGRAACSRSPGCAAASEYGEDWHHAGRRGNKQNVFDDFAAAADWLVATGSHVARPTRDPRALERRAARRRRRSRSVPTCAGPCGRGVPLLDMVRFPQFLIARLWTDEYGDPDVAEEFGWLHAYSPYHRVREGSATRRCCSPRPRATRVSTRCTPARWRRMLQWAAADQDERPMLLLQEGRAGHGVGKPVGKRADELADVLAFYSWQLGCDPD